MKKPSLAFTLFANKKWILNFKTNNSYDEVNFFAQFIFSCSWTITGWLMGICLYFIKLQSSFVAAQSSVLTPAPLLLPPVSWAGLGPTPPCLFSAPLLCLPFITAWPGGQSVVSLWQSPCQIGPTDYIEHILHNYNPPTTLLGVGLLTYIISFLNNDRLLTDADRAATKQDLRLIRIVYNENLIF